MAVDTEASIDAMAALLRTHADTLELEAADVEISDPDPGRIEELRAMAEDLRKAVAMLGRYSIDRVVYTGGSQCSAGFSRTNGFTYTGASGNAAAAKSARSVATPT